MMNVRLLFRTYCCWVELTGGDLLITVGGYPYRELVERISMPDLDVNSMTSMHIARGAHASLELEEYVYVLGGSEGPTKAFERFNCIENRWEILPDLPRGCELANAVAQGKRIFVFGREYYKEFQVDEHTWKAEKLPQVRKADRFFPCFKTHKDEIFIVENRQILPFEQKRLEQRGTYNTLIKNISEPSIYFQCTDGSSIPETQETLLSKK
jgi:hypothetical protein